jgi:hypothetical protein
MYFQTFNKTAFENYQASIKQKEAEQLALEAQTIDKVNCGEQQPEVDHSYKGEKSNSGYDDEQFWRNTRSFISYQLQNKQLEAKYLDIQSLDDFRPDTFEIFIDNKLMEIALIDKSRIRINMPSSEKYLLKISAKDNLPSPRITQIRLLKN